MAIKYPVPQEVLRQVRDAGKLSQAAVAKAMGTVPSVLSKLQKSEEVEAGLAERYLAAVGSALAAEVHAYYEREWRETSPPSFLHPDREVIWEIDSALAKLTAFTKTAKFQPILRGPVDLLRGELGAALQYLIRREHTIAWVGDIGVGKTTALAHAVGLLIGDGRSVRKPAFPVGAGRTTLCETEVKFSPTFGIAIEPLSDEEVIRLARDLVSALATGASGVGVAAELNRALRSMADMRIRRVPAGEDEFTVIDPVADLLAGGLTVDQAVDRVVSAMRLADRRERQALLPEGSLDGLNWLSGIVSRINHGQDERFGLPRRITVLIPSEALSADGQILAILDTRGVEGTTQRPDLIALRDDPRTLIVLCAKFADAPGQSATRFLEDTQSAGSDAWERKRLCILVLPRGDEALQLAGLDEPVATRQEGYAVRRQDVGQALVKAKAGETPTYFFDAMADPADRVWKQLRGQVSEMRAAYALRARDAMAGVQHLIANVDVVKTSEARRAIEGQADRLIVAVRDLPSTVRAPHLNLLEQIEGTHPSSIAASIVRDGDWDNFDIASILGMGVRIDANKRTKDHLSRIEHKLEELELEYAEIRDVVEGLKVLRARVAEGRQEFLTTALAIGRDGYRSLIGKTRDVWDKSVDRYGGGPGYKQEVTGYWREYFESGDADQTASRKAIDGRVQKAWEQAILERLRSATRVDAD